MKKLFLICLTILVCSAPAAAKLYIAEPVLVNQPSHAGMTFYVYKPYNTPKGWYAHFDGYPVFKNEDEVWVYGAYAGSGQNLSPTHYVVGSVIPSEVGLSPYTGHVQISSVLSFNQMPSASAACQTIGARHPMTVYPDWLFNSRFMAVGKWQDSVDRIGVLHKLGSPVAWRGNNPKVLYAWNGYIWYQMEAREGERPVRVLKNNLYTLTKQARHNGFTLYETDIPLLAQQAGRWGYYWMGEVMPR